jgi:hypothetical protein
MFIVKVDFVDGGTWYYDRITQSTHADNYFADPFPSISEAATNVLRYLTEHGRYDEIQSLTVIKI